jgi:hypothetical protein
MQLDPAPRSSKPFLHQSGVVIARVVKKDMDDVPNDDHPLPSLSNFSGNHKNGLIKV